MENLVQNTDTLTRDNLFAGGVMPVVTDKVTLKAGTVYERGTVLGIVTADGKAVKVNSANTDGSQNPYAILADTVDATTEDRPAVAYLTGEFNGAALKFGGTDTVATHKKALREIGIFVKDNQKA
jgi:Bacteriophage lambda head decoration protein D